MPSWTRSFYLLIGVSEFAFILDLYNRKKNRQRRRFKKARISFRKSMIIFKWPKVKGSEMCKKRIVEKANEYYFKKKECDNRITAFSAEGALLVTSIRPCQCQCVITTSIRSTCFLEHAHWVTGILFINSSSFSFCFYFWTCTTIKKKIDKVASFFFF